MNLIDTHSHLYAEEFDEDRDEAILRARQAGVEALLLPAIDSKSHERLFSLVERYPNYCVPMMGLHPTSVNENPLWREELALVEKYITKPPQEMMFCAVGEIGLDYYWSQDYVAEQREAFIAQCRLAAQMNMPVAIHTRSAWDDMCELLEQESAEAKSRGEQLRGVLHAYSEGVETYHRLLGCGDFLFGIGGVVTFKKSPLAAVVAEMDINHIILETDCPYLTPAPHRGKRNESAYVSHICEKVAELKGLSPDEVARITTANARRMFLPEEVA